MISFAIHSRVDNKLSETVRFAIKYFHTLRMPSPGNASAKKSVKLRAIFQLIAKLNVAINVAIKIILTPMKVISMQNPLFPFSSHPEKEWQKTERKTKYFQQKNLRKTKTLRKEIVDVGSP